MKLTDREVNVMTEAMLVYGGSFAQKLAHLMRVADSTNLQRLIDAFPDFVSKYGPETHFYREVCRDRLIQPEEC